jgi:hypothetical protein
MPIVFSDISNPSELDRATEIVSVLVVNARGYAGQVSLAELAAAIAALPPPAPEPEPEPEPGP